MFNKTIVTRLGAMLLISIKFSAQADTLPEQVLQKVEQAARQHLLRQADSSGLVEPKYEVGVVRGSRPLAPCAGPVEVQAVDTRLPARMRFAAVCAGAAGWKFEFVVRAQVSARVAVAAADVAAGKPLREEDVLLERHDISGIADSIADPLDAIGLSGKRGLRSGEVLRQALLVAPNLIKRGDAVRIVAKVEQIEVSMAGEALDNGARGSVVRVRNANGVTIRARVSAAGTVEPVDMPVSTQSPD
ncbi:flagellar basal body P-ring formation protein FlgA [Oxalobacteraceae bacterium]|nr:flagellar basal body P-ring formation protein FlgA [Oxalobacteraceae bacterium]